MRTLVVTNDYSTQVTLDEILRSQRNPIKFCANTAEAWQACLSQSFDLVVLDLLLPTDECRRFCECVRSLPEGERWQILVLSGSAFGADVASALEWGVDDYLTRPLDLKLMRVRLRISEQHAQDLIARRNAEMALRQSEKRFRALIENILDGIVLLNAHGHAVYASPSISRILGYDVDEFVGVNIFDLVHPDDLAASQTFFTALLHASGKTVGNQFRALHTDGSWRWLETIGCNLLLEPAVRALIINFRDITERKIAEETLQRSEARYRNLVESSSDLIWSVDAEGRWTFLNRTASLAILGYEPEELLGRRFTDIQPVRTVEKDWQFFESVKAGEKYFNYETMMLRKDGVLVHLVFNVIVVRNRNGKVLGTTGTASDITQRKAAEDALRQSEARLRLAMNAAEMGSWTLDLKAETAIWDENNCALFGIAPHEWGGKRADFLRLCHTDDIPEINRSLKESIETGTMFIVEFRVRHKDGGVRWIAGFGRAVRNETGTPVCMYGVNMDITERKQREEERQKLESQVQHVQRLESLGVLAGGIAHDFNNLLVGILGNASLALLDLPASMPARENIEEIKSAGLRASELTRQMLAYSGKGRFVVEPLQLSKLVHEMEDLLRVSVSKKAAFKFELERDLRLVLADASQIRQVVMNLVTNASESLGEQCGLITIRTGSEFAEKKDLSEYLFSENAAQGPYVYLEVADTGSGMDDATQSRIFAPFFTTKFTGRGLGLAAVTGILRGHKAAVKVLTEPGKGSCFRILFPEWTVNEKVLMVGESSLKYGQLNRGAVLVVDDEEIVRRVVSQALQRLGFEVITARNGKEGVEMFSRNADKIVLVFLDMTMPEMSGDEACRAMRGVRPGIPIILASGYDEQDATLQFAGLGLSGFIQKPFRIETLIEKAREALARQPVL